uniref:E3 ubiquitin-protein ligase TRIM71-like n=1 Tax=Saccoglossus kowalevskii TaxID=10224 RepID=A0ABM0GKH8_SACKO|nr:PREDICTED: E3 ubiquitin-protein ligase TRIM71-like [Saccoglossus kowalevskii]
MAGAPVSAESILNEVREDFLSCSICFEFFKKPRFLPCLHTFCEKCLVDYKAQSEGVLRCATCRLQCDTPIQGLKSNFFIASLIDSVQKLKQLKSHHPIICDMCEKKPAIHRCVDCSQFCCTSCVKIHERVPALRSHNMLTIDEYTESSAHSIDLSKAFCSDHKDSHLKFYCDTCEVPICSDCTIVNHRVPEHVHRDLQVVAEEYKRQLKNLLEQLKAKEKQLEMKKAAAKNTPDEIQTHCEAEKKKITDKATGVIEKVRSDEKELTDALDVNARKQIKDAELNIEEIEFHHANTVSTQNYLEILMHHGNAVHLLSTRHETTKHVGEMIAMETKHSTFGVIEFHQGSNIDTHGLLGVVKFDTCPPKHSVENIPRRKLKWEFVNKLMVKMKKQCDVFLLTKIAITVAIILIAMVIAQPYIVVEVASPFKSTIENIPKQLVKGESVNLMITIRDSTGKRIETPPHVSAKMTLPSKSIMQDINIVNNNNGTYSVTFSGKMAGQHKIEVKVGLTDGQHIRGSPFNIDVISGYVLTVGNLNDTFGITINKNGDFVTTDANSNRVTIHDIHGKYKQSFKFTHDHLIEPRDISISNENQYFIVDALNQKVVVVDENGKFIRSFGSSILDDPYGIAINSVTKYVYVTDLQDVTRCIRKFTQDGNYVKSFGSRSGLQELYQPEFLAINSDGIVYVADQVDNQILVFNNDDEFMFAFSSTPMSRPRGVAVDENDFVYVSSCCRVNKYDSNGQFIRKIVDLRWSQLFGIDDDDGDYTWRETFWCCGGYTRSELFAIAVSIDGKIAVVDNTKKCITVFVE